jgi:four helix bundle protein
MSSQADVLAARVKAFAVRVVVFVNGLPYNPRLSGILAQLVDAASASSANYRASRRARSRREFVAKIGLVAEEADESEHWLEVLTEGGLISGAGPVDELASLYAEARELRAIFVASAHTARENHDRQRELERRLPTRRRRRQLPDP